jgi:hypothetical protein
MSAARDPLASATDSLELPDESKPLESIPDKIEESPFKEPKLEKTKTRPQKALALAADDAPEPSATVAIVLGTMAAESLLKGLGLMNAAAPTLEQLGQNAIAETIKQIGQRLVVNYAIDKVIGNGAKYALKEHKNKIESTIYKEIYNSLNEQNSHNQLIQVFSSDNIITSV